MVLKLMKQIFCYNNPKAKFFCLNECFFAKIKNNEKVMKLSDYYKREVQVAYHNIWSKGSNSVISIKFSNLLISRYHIKFNYHSSTSLDTISI